VSVVNLSNCLTDKQIGLINDRIHTLGFDLGTALDQCFFDILTNPAPFNVCDGEDIPQDTGGVGFVLCVTDGVCTFISKAEAAAENNTTLVLDSNCQLNYTNEEGNNPPIDLTTIDVCKLEPFKSLPEIEQGIVVVGSDGLGNVTKDFTPLGNLLKDNLLSIQCKKFYDGQGREFIRKVIYDLNGDIQGTPEDFELDLVTPFVAVDPVTCEPPKKVYPVIGSEVVEYTASADFSLTPVTGSRGASLFFEMSPDCEALIKSDGTPTTSGTPFTVYDCARVELGCTENSNSDSSELSGFRVRGNGCQGKIIVTYY